MNRMTQKDEQGNWSLRGVKWEQLYAGQIITGEVYELLYGALWKLMEYEDTRLTPDEVDMMIESKKTMCKDCSYKKFVPGNGRPGRYYCEHPEARFARSECEPTPLICRTGRHDDEMTVKTRPRWCPLSDAE